jgi:hypothetical protein
VGGEPADALIDAGADIEAPGGSIGSPLDNAIGYGCWHVARRVVERGARVDKLWHAAALGLMSRVHDLLAASPAPVPQEINEAFWQACHGGQCRTADYILERVADINTNAEYAYGLDVATGPTPAATLWPRGCANGAPTRRQHRMTLSQRAPDLPGEVDAGLHTRDVLALSA